MATQARELIQDSPHAQYLDEAVDEVFRLMMGLPCSTLGESGIEGKRTITAVIGLAGAISGTCILICGEQAALRMAECMVGVSPREMDATVKDAIGEVCNMIAGAWKGKHPILASGCMLSTPAVVTGTNYQLHIQRPEFCVDRHYRFEEQALSISIVCEFIQ